MKRVFVLGWDGVPPSIAFDELLDEMPNLKKLLANSIYGPLRSTKPPITVPAWMSMMTGCDPGQLGLYGFRHHKPGDYKEIWIPDSKSVNHPRVWDIVSAAGGEVVVIGVPPTYPPTKVNGILVSGFLAPDTSCPFTYPSSLSKEISDIVGDYKLDVFYRTEKKDDLCEDLFDMTIKRHELAKHFLKARPWNLFVLMEVGSDRLHHGFWKYYDKSHPRYEEDAHFRSTFIKYYKLLDKNLGEILELIPEDSLFLLVSDHGAKARKGAFCINQWLREQGLLSLVNEPKDPVRFEDLEIDWKKTKAWAWGGYYARIFINTEGYEKDGCVAPEDYEDFRNHLIHLLHTIKGPNGEDWIIEVDKPEDVYEDCTGDYPDLMLYIDDLRWRASSSIGHESLYFYDDSIGPDDAVHDWFGIFVAKRPLSEEHGIVVRSILDITPTILEHMNLKTPDYMKGAPIGK